MSESKCPFTGHHGSNAFKGMQTNRDWWPNQLNIRILHQHSEKSNPMGTQFNYSKEFKN